MRTETTIGIRKDCTGHVFEGGPGTIKPGWVGEFREMTFSERCAKAFEFSQISGHGMKNVKKQAVAPECDKAIEKKQRTNIFFSILLRRSGELVEPIDFLKNDELLLTDFLKNDESLPLAKRLQGDAKFVGDLRL